MDYVAKSPGTRFRAKWYNNFYWKPIYAATKKNQAVFRPLHNGFITTGNRTPEEVSQALSDAAFVFSGEIRSGQYFSDAIELNNDRCLHQFAARWCSKIARQPIGIGHRRISSKVAAEVLCCWFDANGFAIDKETKNSIATIYKQASKNTLNDIGVIDQLSELKVLKSMRSDKTNLSFHEPFLKVVDFSQKFADELQPFVSS